MKSTSKTVDSLRMKLHLNSVQSSKLKLLIQNPTGMGASRIFARELRMGLKKQKTASREQ